MIDTVLLIVAFILFVVGAAGVSVGRINAVAAGLACWVLTLLI